MKIRSITLFAHPGPEINDRFLGFAKNFAAAAKQLIPDSGLEFQTIRFATPPFPELLEGMGRDDCLSYAAELEKNLNPGGFEYISLGPALPEHPESYDLVPDLLGATQNTFCSGLMTREGKGVSLLAVKACGEIIHQLAPQDPDGFANLYFAALGNVPAGAPFFPAAYHAGPDPTFAIAMEGADLALDAFQQGTGFREARELLISVLEQNDRKIGEFAAALEKETGTTFGGIDYSLAPFPGRSSSIGSALESLGVKKIGLHGSLAASAFLADTIDRAQIQRTGFSGLMLPVLEDSTLARRAADGSLGIKDLLLYAAVCGTGLDTIPLPGDTSAAQISAVLFDLAALSLRLDKPLTARMMPIPGKKAGDKTNFDFPFFANSKVMAIEAAELSGSFSSAGYLDIQVRK